MEFSPGKTSERDKSTKLNSSTQKKSEEKFDKILHKLSSSRASRVEKIHQIGQLAVSENKDEVAFAVTFIQEILKTFKLPPKEFLKAWESNSRPTSKKFVGKKEEEYPIKEAAEDMVKIIARNSLCMSKIEAKHPGICKFLYESYGIRNFGRFTPETWIAQYEQRENSEPYGLVISARDDWNASSYDDGVDQTYEKLRTNIGEQTLRVIEAGDLLELAKILFRLKLKKWPSPSFVVWSGHYGQNEFLLGPGRHRKVNYKFSIGKEDFEDERIKKYLDMFSKNTVMILDSCGSEPKEYDLPSLAASALGNNFIHPRGKTRVKDFGVTTDTNGNLLFNVEYDFNVGTIITEDQTSEKFNM